MVGDPEKNETYQRVKFLMNAMVEGKMHPGLVYRELLAMKKVEEPEVKTDSVEPPSDSVAVALPDSTSN